MEKLICICCPKGCHLSVDPQNNFAVTGNGCPRGEEYGRNEVTNPVRVVTATVAADSCEHPRCSVKTSSPVPKGKVFDVVAELSSIKLTPPVKIGSIIVKNILGLGADIVATSAVNR